MHDTVMCTYYKIQVFFLNADSLSLKKLCSSVIIRALLCQRGLKPDHLQTRLPQYVPPTVKHHLADRLKALVNTHLPDRAISAPKVV